MTARDHKRFEDDVGAYVLGALTELEQQAFEQHLAGCEICQEDLVHLRGAAEALPRSVEQYRAPDSLKQSLMATVREEAEVREPEKARRAPALGRFRPALPRLRPEFAWVAAAAVLALALVSAAFYQLGQRSDADTTIAAKVDESRVPDAGGRLVIPDEDGGAILEVNGVPRPVGRQVLHVWVKRGDRILPSSMFQVDANGVGAAAIPEDLDDGDLIMVTRESGPVMAPTEEPILTVDVRS